jgi:hypothetical protein
VRSAALGVLVLLSIEGAARAGRSSAAWIFDTETVPERGVELEQWISDEHRQGPTHEYDTSIWWAPVIGVTDQLELALPIEWDWTKSDVESPRTVLSHFGAELRYRFVTSDPVEAPAWVPLVRVAVKRPIYEAESAQIEADAVVSYTCGRLHAVADLGGYAILTPGGNLVATKSGAAISWGVTDELRLGAETYGEADVSGGSSDDTWVIAGPDLSWTHGRIWITAAFGIGVYQITSAPRIKWGIAF